MVPLMTLNEFLKARGIKLHKLCQLTGIAYSTLHPHATKGKRLSLETAEKLEAWSEGAMSAAEILGLKAPAPRPADPTP